jgi:hypothetical protein
VQALHGVAFGGEILRQQLAELDIVVDHEDGELARSRRA